MIAITVVSPSIVVQWSRWRARFTALVALLSVSLIAGALELDPGFGAHGYVPVSAPETQTDTAAAIIRQPDNMMVVLGTRLDGLRGTLLLQRYAADGTMDLFFGMFGTATIDVAGESLTAKQLILENNGRLLVVAETATTLRIYALLANGQPDTSYGAGGELKIPFAPGVGPGTSSVHLLDSGQLYTIMQNSSAGGSLYVSRYLTSGVLDAGFALQGKEVVTGLGAGTFYTGVVAQHPDQRFIVALAGENGVRGLLALDKNGQADIAVNSGHPVFPAALQGALVTKLAPLVGGYFVAAAVSGPGGAQASTITRFDPASRPDPLFGSNGTLAIQAASGGGSIAIVDVYENLDNTLVVTGSTNNGFLAARYFPNGQPDLSFNAGNGLLLVPEPGSRATAAVKSIRFPDGQIVHVGTGILYGTGTGGSNLSRAFLFSSVGGVTDIHFASKGLLNLFGRKPPNTEFAQYVTPLADGKILVLSATGVNDGLVGTLTRYLPNGSPDPTFGTQGRSSHPLNGKCEWPLSMTLQADGKILVLGTNFNMIDCDTAAMFGKRFDSNGVQENFQLFYSGVTQRARSGAIAVQQDGRIVVTGEDDGALVVARFVSGGALDASFGTVGRILFQASQGEHTRGGALLIRPDQKILVAGSGGGFRLVLLQLNGDGTPDASFGAGGVSQLSTASNFLEVQALAMTPAGKLLVLARSGQRALLAQFQANGAPDASFGNGGQLLLPLFIGGATFSRFGMSVQPDGGIIVSGQSVISLTSELELMRLTAAGQVDPTFGSNGVFAWRPSVFYPAGATGIAATSSGSIYVIGYGIPGAFVARLGASIPTVAVVEFYNTLLNHYFITANSVEQSGIDNGAAGPGWERTGKSFRAYLQALGVPAGQVPVCRFYGSTAIDPATGQRRGPNSHFYTAVAAECAAVQLDPGWTLEGFAFHIGLPSGGCPAGLIPVYRNYNQRAQFNDSNHRYTIDFGIYQQMQALGWAGEGIVFCAAQ